MEIGVPGKPRLPGNAGAQSDSSVESPRTTDDPDLHRDGHGFQTPHRSCTAKGVGATLPRPDRVAQPFKPDPNPSTRKPAGFIAWLGKLRSQAEKAGISEKTLNTILAPDNSALPFDPVVIRAKSAQPELRDEAGSYIESRLDRLGERAVGHLRKLGPQLEAFANTGGYIPIQGDPPKDGHGVPPEVVIALWGMESGFGKDLGSHDIFSALGSLGFHDAKRRDLWVQNFIAALHLVQSGHVDRRSLQGSWAGAWGQTQFLPENVTRYGVDATGDGRTDLRGDRLDALASTGHFLMMQGYRRGQPILSVVTLSDAFDYRLSGRGRRLGDERDASKTRTVEQWRDLGVNVPKEIPGDLKARVVLPQGHKGPAFLIYDNYYALLGYNNSDKYALTGGLLAQRGVGVDHDLAWPAELGLSSYESKALQEILKKEKLYSGLIDGILGLDSQDATQTLQAQEGFVPDGYPNRAFLEHLAKKHGITELPPRPLIFEERAWLQAGLQHAGFDPKGLDGLWGPGAQGAFSAYLECTGRTADIPQRIVLDALGPPVLAAMLRERGFEPGSTPEDLKRAVNSYRDRHGLSETSHAGVVAHMLKIAS